MAMIERIAMWLEEGEEDAEKLLDMPWDVVVKRDDEEDMISATHPKIPFPIMLYVSKHFVQLYMDPGIATDTMDVAERMRTYRKLLHINTDYNLMKIGLVGEEHRIVVEVDLDVETLDKQTFNAALTVLIFGTTHVVKSLGLTEELTKLMFERTAEMVYEMLKEGASKDDIKEFLELRVGMDKKDAVTLLENMLK